MTTLAALATKDSLIMGCDSLGSVTKKFVDPFDLIKYFDPENNFQLKVDPSTGKPLLDTFHDIFGKSQIIPYNHMTYVDKLFSLDPLPIGVMTTGIASVGNFTIKNLINQFKSKDTIFKSKNPKNFTVKSVANKLLKFMKAHYDAEFGSQPSKPSLEMIIGGYDKRKQLPTILRIHIHEDKIEKTIDDFGIVFGGQMQEIQRITFGTDTFNRINVIQRLEYLFKQYYTDINNLLKANNISIDIPKPDVINKYNFFSGWDFDGFKLHGEIFLKKML